MMLPRYMEAITPQKTSGCSTIRNGPGLTPLMSRQAKIMAMAAFPGIPRVSRGMKEELDAALLADSGPATPAMAPCPNSSGCFGDFLFHGIRQER